MPFDFDMDSISPVNTGGGGSSVNISPLNIIPTTSAQNFVPAAGNAYAPVNVSGVTSAIDPNITASNIVNGVEILGVVGTASASAPKEVARYQVDDDGVADVSGKNLTGAFDDITNVKNNAFLNAFYLTNVSGTVSFPNCTHAGINSFTNAFRNTKISDVSFPNLTSATSAFVSAFVNCNINNVDFHSVVTLTAGVYSSAFANSVVNFANFGSVVDASVGFPGAFYASTINGVDFSNVKYTDLGGFSTCFYSSKGLTSISYPSLTHVGDRAFNAAFSNSDLISFDAQNISYVNTNGFNRAFSDALNFTYFNVSENMIIRGNEAFSSTFRNSNILSFKLSSTLGDYSNCFKDAFNNCQNLISVNMSAQSTYNTGINFFYSFCRNCTNLTDVDLSSLKGMALVSSSQTFGNAFAGDVNLTTVNLYSLSNLPTNSNDFRNAFLGCSKLTSMDFPALWDLGAGGCFDNAFANSGIQNLSFSGMGNFYFTLLNSYHPFGNMLKNVEGCTVHFPSSFPSSGRSHTDVVAGFGGTNTTILFDLPSVTNSFANFYNITENGEMGGQSIAVNASSENVNAWRAIHAVGDGGWHSAVSEAPHYYTIYCHDGLRLTYIRFVTAYDVNGVTNTPVMINVCASNDDINWEEVNTTFDKEIISGGASYVTTTFLKPGYYKYYKFFFNSYNNDPSYLVTINSMTINGTYKYTE